MYTVFGIMLTGMVLGRLFRDHIPGRFLRPIIMGAIFLLLFLLGVSIGSNSSLLANLPNLGLDALFLTLFFIFGSVGAQCLLKKLPIFKKFMAKFAARR